MAKSDDAQNEGQAPARVYKSGQVHKRRVDKTARKDLRKQERETAREQARQDARVQEERQQRFAVIHGGKHPSRQSFVAVSAAETDAAEDAVQESTSAAVSSGKLRTAAERSDAKSSSDAATDAPKRPSVADKSKARLRRAQQADSENQAADPDAADAASSGDAAGNTARPRRRRRIVLIVAAAVVAVLVVFMGIFSWNRWLRWDDAEEIQGEWFAANNGRRAPIVIQDDRIVFNEETSWGYTLDPTAKTIAFTFGSQEGGGRYWFTSGHEHLIIQDGMEFSAQSTFFADLKRLITGKANEVPSGEGFTVLSRSASAAQDPPAAQLQSAGSSDEADSSAEADALPDDSAGSGEASAEGGAAREGAG